MRVCLIVLGLLAACDAEEPAPPLVPPPAPPAAVEDTVEDIGSQAPTEPAKKLNGGDKKTTKRGGIRKSKYDPPVDIPHLEDTPADLREKIDKYIEAMFDPSAGRDSTDAKYELIKIGKPAFPRILAKMAQVRDVITNVDTDDERLIESTLKLADEALREMDGYLTSHSKPVLRPGSEKRYIAYICRLHYKRWVTTLRDLPEMPGPYDPATDFGDSDRGILILELLKHWTGDERPSRWGGDEHATASMFKELFAASAGTIEHMPRIAWPLLESIPSRMKEERFARMQIGPVLADGLAHGSPHLRKLAVECLRVLFDENVGYDPDAAYADRQKKIARWRAVIAAAGKQAEKR